VHSDSRFESTRFYLIRIDSIWFESFDSNRFDTIRIDSVSRQNGAVRFEHRLLSWICSLPTLTVCRPTLYAGIVRLNPVHTVDDDATQLSSWVASALCTEFATSSRQLLTCAFTPPTRHNSTQLRCWQICSDSSRLSPTRCEFRTHCRRDSTRQLSRVGGVYWALVLFHNSDSGEMPRQ